MVSLLKALMKFISKYSKGTVKKPPRIDELLIFISFKLLTHIICVNKYKKKLKLILGLVKIKIELLYLGINA